MHICMLARRFLEGCIPGSLTLQNTQQSERGMTTTKSALAIIVAPVVSAAAVACYNTFGNMLGDGFLPCNASLSVTHCCGGTDYCLSNGLCLDAGGNNVMTQQGCTNALWPSPCHKYCSKHGSAILSRLLITCTLADRRYRL